MFFFFIMCRELKKKEEKHWRVFRRRRESVVVLCIQSIWVLFASKLVFDRPCSISSEFFILLYFILFIYFFFMTIKLERANGFPSIFPMNKSLLLFFSSRPAHFPPKTWASLRFLFYFFFGFSLTFTIKQNFLLFQQTYGIESKWIMVWLCIDCKINIFYFTVTPSTRYKMSTNCKK